MLLLLAGGTPAGALQAPLAKLWLSRFAEEYPDQATAGQGRARPGVFKAACDGLEGCLLVIVPSGPQLSSSAADTRLYSGLFFVSIWALAPTSVILMHVESCKALSLARQLVSLCRQTPASLLLLCSPPPLLDHPHCFPMRRQPLPGPGGHFFT